MVYGGITGVVLLTSLTSASEALQKIALLLLTAWASTNASVHLLGFTDAPLLIPSIDVVVAMAVALVGYRYRSRIALVVFSLYLAVSALHVVAFVSRWEGGYAYYAALNALFLAQLISVGAPGAWLAIHRWVAARRERARPHPALG